MTVISGAVTFSNQSLRLTPVLGGQGPLWQLDPHPVQLEERTDDFIHASFACLTDSTNNSPGAIWENEHGLVGEFYLAPPYFDLLQKAALSAADLEITVLFGAQEEMVEALMLSIQHKTA